MTDRRELPTASRRGDLSRNGRASAASAGRESALFGAYRHPAPVIVDQPCACGGVIRATMDDIAEIVTAIRCHQETTIHLIWRWREEIA